MIQEPRETLGAILRSRKFLAHVVYFICCATIVVLVSVKHLWIQFLILNPYAIKGLLMANYLGFFSTFCILVSWILVDDISWLGKAIFLFVSGILMTICGAFYTIKFLNIGTVLYADEKRGLKYTGWLPAVGVINFLMGIFTLLVFIYVVLTWDS